MGIAEILVRVVLIYAALLFLTRIMGRKEISQMTFFNFASAITIGSVAANVVINPSTDLINGLAALAGWTALTLLIDAVVMRSIRSRHLISGQPLIVIKDGKIVERSLITARLTLDYLMALLRQQNIFTTAEVEYAIFEIDGKLSVLKKDVFVPLTKYDMNLPVKETKYKIPTTVISDGRVILENIRNLKLEQNWLIGELKKQDVKNVKEVLFAQVQTDGSLLVEKKQRTGNTLI